MRSGISVAAVWIAASFLTRTSIGGVVPTEINPPSEGAWSTGAYRNLFVESGAHTEEEVSSGSVWGPRHCAPTAWTSPCAR